MGIPSTWRLRNQRLALVGEVCHTCGNSIFPPRDVCPHCAREAQQAFQFSGRGEVYSFTTVYNAPSGFEEYAPYTVALVKLEEGPLVTAQLADVEPEQVTIGQPVEMVTRKLRDDGRQGIINYGYKFRPRLAVSAES
jgi:uncharacterized OB-fold protein